MKYVRTKEENKSHGCFGQANLCIREVLLGITGKDFTLIAASRAAMRGPTILKATDDKTRQLNTHTLMAFSGEAGDTGKYIERLNN